MRKVIGIGETVMDIVFKDGQPQRAVPGGSTFNSMVSLGRCGVPAEFLSEIGKDKVGDIIRDFMTWNGVSSEHVNFLPNKTPLSLAFLNESNDAEYVFYRDKVQDHPDFIYPEINQDDIVLYGSFYAISPSVRPLVKRFLEYSKARGAILYYDVNFRPSHLKDLGNIGNAVWENFGFADIVRGSHEDFITLFDIDDADEVYREKVAPYCRHFICTCGAEPLQVRDAGGFSAEFPVERIKTVSTIGAGDNFNAGFLYGMVKYGITKADIELGLSAGQWRDLILCGQSFSADCCQSLQNYVTPEFAAEFQI